MAPHRVIDRLGISFEIKCAVRRPKPGTIGPRGARGIIGHPGVASRAAQIGDLDRRAANRGDRAVGDPQRLVPFPPGYSRRQIGDPVRKKKTETPQHTAHGRLIGGGQRVALPLVEHERRGGELPRDRTAVERFDRNAPEPRSKESRGAPRPGVRIGGENRTRNSFVFRFRRQPARGCDEEDYGEQRQKGANDLLHHGSRACPAA